MSNALAAEGELCMAFIAAQDCCIHVVVITTAVVRPLDVKRLDKACVSFVHRGILFLLGQNWKDVARCFGANHICDSLTII